MLSIDEWLDERPYKELYDGTIHKKVSPTFDHGVVAGIAHGLLLEWGREFGAVIIELRVYLDEGLTLVPDVSFVEKRRLASLPRDYRDRFPAAPDIVVEVRSPGDRDANVRRKTELYLRYGTTLVLDVDPVLRTVVSSTTSGERRLNSGLLIEHAAFLGLSIPVAELFSPLDQLP